MDRVSIGRAVCLVLMLSTAGCESWKPETGGEVSVGRPQVYSRERLLQERSSELAWMDDQLNRPFEQGLQGLRDVREASAVVFDLSLRFDELKRRQAGIERAKEDAETRRGEAIAAKQHEIDMERLNQQLTALKAATSPASAPEGSASPNADLVKINASIDDINKKLAAIEDKLKPAVQRTDPASLFAKSSERLVNPNTAERTTAFQTSLERFEDEAAFRDAVNSRKREKILDDTHDLAGMALYELKFDASIIPGSNTRRRAVVELTIDKGSLSPEGYVKDPFIRRLTHRVKEDANVLLMRQHERLQAGKLSPRLKEWILATNPGDLDEQYRDKQTCGERNGDLRNRVLRNLPFASAADKENLQIGQCLLASYLRRRLVLALSDYFDFDIVWGTNLAPARAEGLVPLLNVRPRPEETRRALVSKLTEHEFEQRPWIATVDPKEYAQNISDVASDNMVRQISLALGVSDGAGLAGETNAQFFKQRQEVVQAIKRQALATSFHNGRDKFGWVLGPKFEIRDNHAVFVHTPARYTFGASVVVPGWYSELQMSGCGYWIEANGERSSQTLAPFGGDCSQKVTINLPHSHRYLLHALMDSNQDVFNTPEIFMPRLEGQPYVLRLTPVACALAPDRSCEQTLVIEGRELWRNPTVYVGNQKADRVDLLPSMRGIVATFRSFSPPGASNAVRKLDLFVSTSTGEDRLEQIVDVLPAEPSTEKGFARMEHPFLDRRTTDPMLLSYIFKPGAFPPAYAGLMARVRPAGSSLWNDLSGDAQRSAGGVAYALGDATKIGLADKPVDVEADLLVRYSPEAAWVSVMEPGAGRFLYLPDIAARQLVHAPKAAADFSGKTGFGDAERTKLQQALRVTLPKNAALFYRAYPGLETALKAGGPVRMTLAAADQATVVLRMEGAGTKDSGALIPSRVTLASAENVLVPHEEQERTYTLAVGYQSAPGTWTDVALAGNPEAKITGRKKTSVPATDPAASAAKP